MMELNEIKKELYKQNPDAHFYYIRHGDAHYYTDLNGQRIYFDIPVIDMGDADFGARMDSKLLIRWIRKQ